MNVFLLVEIKHKGNMNYNTELNFIILKCDINSNVFSQFDFLHPAIFYQNEYFN